MKKTLLVATALTLSASTAAFAQSAAGGSSTSGQVEEVVVTAQKRSENIQSVPLSIVALTGRAIQENGITNVKGLADQLSGVEIQGVNAPAVFIRGVGTSNSSSTGDQGVALHLDGVFQARPTAFSAAFLDINQVEVLKGPQGTLYGRGALGGNVNVISNAPSHEFGGSASLEVGDYDLVSATAVLNVPLADNLATRVAIESDSHDGYSSNGGDDAGVLAARFRVQYQPTKDITLGLIAFYTDDHGEGATYHRFRSYPGLPLNSDPWSNSVSDGQYLSDNTSEISAKAEWNLGFATLTYIPAYTQDHYAAQFPSLVYEPQPFNVASVTDSDLTSHELRLSSPSGGKFEWTVGGFYMDERLDYSLSYKPFVQTSGTFQTESESLFGQGSLELFPGLRLIGGLRINRDTKTQDTNLGYDYKSSWDSTTPKIGLEWTYARTHLLYFTVSDGFKPGGFYTAPPPNTFAPETVRAYELGSKNTFWDRRLQLNGSIYYNAYDNYQANANVAGYNGSTTQGVINAGAAELYGADLDAIFNVTSLDRLEASLTYLHSEFTTFVANVTSGKVGDQLPYSPNWSANIAYQHVFDLPGGATLTPRLETHIQSKEWLSLNHRQFTDQDDFTRSSVTVTYRPSGEPFKVSAWVRNLENSAVVNTVSDTKGFETGILEPPRTYGMTVSTNF